MFKVTTTHQTSTHTNTVTNKNLTADAVQALKDSFHRNATAGDTVTHKVTAQR